MGRKTPIKPPVRFQKLYDIGPDGTLNVVEFVEETIAPGASEVTWKCRKWTGSRYENFSVATDYFCLTLEEAYLRRISELGGLVTEVEDQLDKLKGHFKRLRHELVRTKQTYERIKAENKA